MSRQFWLNLQTSYALKIALRESASRIERDMFPHAIRSRLMMDDCKA